ncbi:MAG: hypothetical protein ACI9VI_000571 [Candidatus Azotimanducaceae bacterium]|jgi:hypothetical protein
MEHVLGTPLVSEVFNKVVDKGQRRVIGQYRAAGIATLQTPDNRGGVTDGLDASVLIEKKVGSEIGLGFSTPIASQTPASMPQLTT